MKMKFNKTQYKTIKLKTTLIIKTKNLKLLFTKKISFKF